MNRYAMIQQLRSRAKCWDIVVIGGGATGIGIAVDAAARGYSVALLEKSDFGKATSSRSTKLIHGGVRYLQQANVSLVREALHERTILRRNAPHLVRPLPFVLPTYRWTEQSYYGLGLWLYDRLAGRHSFGHSRCLSPAETLTRLPSLKTSGCPSLQGGVLYFDGQFDDARLLINLVQTAVEQGAMAVNYLEVKRLLKSATGKIAGVVAVDTQGDNEIALKARVVINATGAFADELRQLDEADSRPIIAPSQGVHVVLDRSFLPSDSALIIPRTSDGRVLFAIPWQGVVLAGTTDTPVEKVSLEPVPLREEILFVLETLGQYLDAQPTHRDILSTFAGIRPLVQGGGKKTAKLSRDHTILTSSSGLLTIAGGKWTTYRRMAEDCVNRAQQVGDLPLAQCTTRELKIHGHLTNADTLGWRSCYGSDAEAIVKLASDGKLSQRLEPTLPYEKADVLWAVRNEMALTVDDVLARRTRAILLNAQAAINSAHRVASWMAQELGHDEQWQNQQTKSFRKLAAGYLPAGI